MPSVAASSTDGVSPGAPAFWDSGGGSDRLGEARSSVSPPGDRNTIAPSGFAPLGFTVRNLLVHPPHCFPPSFSSVHESKVGGQDQTDRHTVRRPQSLGLSMVSMSLCPSQAHLLGLSRLPETPASSGLCPHPMRPTCAPRSTLAPVLHLPYCPPACRSPFTVTSGPPPQT